MKALPECRVSGTTAPGGHMRLDATSAVKAVDASPLPAISARQLKDNLHMAVPRSGYVVSSVAEMYGKPIRRAIASLAAAMADGRSWEDRSISPPKDVASRRGAVRSEAELKALSVVASWVVGVATEELAAQTSLDEAEAWFRGSSKITGSLPAQAVRAAEESLQRCTDAEALFQLLPYVLDPDGPGSRLSVRRDPSTGVARQRKRSQGVFYTPVDVADYMVQACLDNIAESAVPTIFDPACGTGVFLRASLQVLIEKYPDQDGFTLAKEHLFGADIDPWALDATAFVLLADTWTAAAAGTDLPLESWRVLRENLAEMNSLLIDPPPGDAYESAARLFDMSQGGTPITELFARLKRRPSVILGNPPYASLGPRDDLLLFESRLQTIAAKPVDSAEVYVAFLEQMVRLCDTSAGSGALVLPLSIAYSVGRQFIEARQLVARTPGRWRFAFFDREPHALFGEDVKTRNAIVLWSRRPQDTTSVISTGPLRKWRGDSRADMFRGLGFTEIDNGIRDGIPKLDGECQAAAYRLLRDRTEQLSHVAKSLESVGLAEVPTHDARTVFVGPTAYNFLNVFLGHVFDQHRAGKHLSEHQLHAVRCASEADALAVFAILSSHLAYWWWRTVGDGFHVSKRFIASLPFARSTLAPELTDAGGMLWQAIKPHPIISVNRGRTTVAYSPNGHDDMRKAIDIILARHAGLADDFVQELQQFTAHTINATPTRLPVGAPGDGIAT